MIDDKFTEIGLLAEAIAEENIEENSVNLRKISDSNSITIISGNYENYFLGELVYEANEFFIHLNFDLLPSEDSPRTRFTIAHELGHYFIDNHRNILISGISLHKTVIDGGNNRGIEKEANYFASNLLMPTKRFIRLAHTFEPGICSILNLKSQFDSSLESTAIRYIQLDISPCILIRWNEDITPRYISPSKSFNVITGINGKPNISFNAEHVRQQFILLDNLEHDSDYIVEDILLSKWIPFLVVNSSKDIRCIQQTYRLGNYGGLTLIMLPC